MFAVALPVVPSLGLKSSVLGGGSGGGGLLAVLGISGGAASGGGATVAKIAAVGALAGGGVAAGGAAVSHERAARAPEPTTAVVEQAPVRAAPSVPGVARIAEGRPAALARGNSAQPGSTARQAPPERSAARDAPTAADGNGRPAEPGAQGRERPAPERAAKAQGRGPVETPPSTPVRRGPPEARGKPEVPGAQTRAPAAERGGARTPK